MVQLQAVMVVVQREDKYLLGKRALWKKTAPGYWCPISGKIEPGESEEQAVARELMEEIGVVARVGEKIKSIDSHDGRVRLHWWTAEIVSGEPHIANDENLELGWFTLEEMSALRPVFAEDIEVIKRAFS